MKPILSICIPTYNRDSYLEKTLDMLVQNEIFLTTNKIEVVISDNASTDKTQEICLKYEAKYSNIKYFRNDENLIEENFYLALKRGTGLCRKLHNDRIYFYNDELTKAVDFVEQHQKEKPIIFFLTNLTELNEDIIYPASPDEFIKAVFYHITWIGSFSLWEDDLETYKKNNTLYVHTHLPQMAVLGDFFRQNREIIIYNIPLIGQWPLSGLRSAKHVEIFAINYITFLEDFLRDGCISEKTFKAEKKRILLKLINPSYFQFHMEIFYLKNNYWKNTKKYHTELYFYLGLIPCSWYKIKYFVVRKYKYKLKHLYYSLCKNEEKKQKYAERCAIYRSISQ